MKHLFLFISMFIIAFPIYLFGNQLGKPEIRNIKIENQGDSVLFVYFDLVGYKKNERFDIVLDAKFQAGKKVEVLNLSGDLVGVFGGNSKQLKWAISKDIYDFNGFLSLKLKFNSTLGNTFQSETKLVKVFVNNAIEEAENIDPENDLLAEIEWIKPDSRNLAVTQKLFSIQACIFPKNEISEVNLYLNNQFVPNTRGFKPIDGNCKMAVKNEFELNDGLNEIRLEVIDKEGVKTESFILVSYTKKE